jgi:hypothetical protein
MARLNLDLVTASAATVYNNANLGTTPVRVPTPASTGFTGSIARQCVVTNRSASSAYVAYLLTSAASPSFTASAAGAIAATDGTPVFPLSQSFVNFKAASTPSVGLHLWLVASAGSTPVQLTAYDTEVR